MEWIKLQTVFLSEAKATQAAGIVATTEGRLNNQPGGPQHDVETRVEREGETWRVLWRKVFTGYSSGCGGGCGSCGDNLPKGEKGKVIPFRKPPAK